MKMIIKGELTKQDLLRLIRNEVAKELGERPRKITIKDVFAEETYELHKPDLEHFKIKFTVEKEKS